MTTTAKRGRRTTAPTAEELQQFREGRKQLNERHRLKADVDRFEAETLDTAHTLAMLHESTQRHILRVLVKRLLPRITDTPAGG